MLIEPSWRRDLDIFPMVLHCALKHGPVDLMETYEGTITDYETPDPVQDEFHNKLSIETPNQHIRQYTASSHRLNTALYKHYLDNANVPSAEVLAQVRGIDASIPHQHHGKYLPLYTGVYESPAKTAGMEWNSSRPKKLIDLPRYTSTSTDMGTAIAFAQRDSKTEHHESDHHGVILPNARHIIQLNLHPDVAHSIVSAKSFSSIPSEQEVILGRGYQFELHPRPTLVNSKSQQPVYIWHAHNGDVHPFKPLFKEEK